MQIKYREIQELKRAEYNPRYITSKAKEQLKVSVVKFGMVEPVIINVNPKRKDVIIGGHQRIDILEALGVKMVPCIELNLTEEEEKELNIRLNRGGEFDIELLKANYKVEELESYGFEPYEIGLFEYELEEYNEGERKEKIEVESEEEEPDGEISVAITETEDFIYMGIDLRNERGPKLEKIAEIKNRFYPKRQFWQLYRAEEDQDEQTATYMHLVSPKGEKMPELKDIIFLESEITFL